MPADGGKGEHTRYGEAGETGSQRNSNFGGSSVDKPKGAQKNSCVEATTQLITPFENDMN